MLSWHLDTGGTVRPMLRANCIASATIDPWHGSRDPHSATRLRPDAPNVPNGMGIRGCTRWGPSEGGSRFPRGDGTCVRGHMGSSWDSRSTRLRKEVNPTRKAKQAAETVRGMRTRKTSGRAAGAGQKMHGPLSKHVQNRSIAHVHDAVLRDQTPRTSSHSHSRCSRREMGTLLMKALSREKMGS